MAYIKINVVSTDQVSEDKNNAQHVKNRLLVIINS